jgi:hypothetical protein
MDKKLNSPGNLLKHDIMRINIIIFILGAVVWGLSSCSKINDNFAPYLENGEIIYIGKADSVKTFAGKNRFLIQFIVKDPRANALHIYWNQRSDSLVFPIAQHEPYDVFSLYIGGNEKPFGQGSYTLELITKSKDMFKSIPVFTSVNVYGDRFAQTLVPKIVRSVTNAGGKVTITWGGAISEREVGVALEYVNALQRDTAVYRTTTELKTPTVLQDIDLTQGLKYKTLYLPEPAAVDTFTVDGVIEIPQL